jgi:hypothetical protein
LISLVTSIVVYVSLMNFELEKLIEPVSDAAQKDRD